MVIALLIEKRIEGQNRNFLAHRLVQGADALAQNFMRIVILRSEVDVTSTHLQVNTNIATDLRIDIRQGARPLD